MAYGAKDEEPNLQANSHEGTHVVGGVSVEVFWATVEQATSFAMLDQADQDAKAEAGWYWWACQPGCLPEGDAFGPFNTSGDAHEDAVAAYAGDDPEVNEGRTEDDATPAERKAYGRS